MAEEWRKVKDSNAEYSVINRGGHKVLRVKFTFNPKLESPKAFVQKTSILYENRPDNIYHIFRMAYVSKSPEKWERMKKNLTRAFPSEQDRKNYINYLRMHKNELDKYLDMAAYNNDK